MPDLPAPYRLFQEKYPDLWKAYDQFGAQGHRAGPLDEKTCELVKLGIAIGSQSEGAVHSHVRKALEAGASADEVLHVVLLSSPTVGWPSMMAAYTWVQDILSPNP